jgi:hypothetical protein
VLIGGLAWYDVSRAVAENGAFQWSSPLLFPAIAVLVFTGHHLIAAGDEAGRLIAPYDRYFDLGWRHGAQLALAVLFTGAFWAVLGLGAALFFLIKLHFLSDLIAKTWFNIPVTTTMFAAAIQLTDLRSGLVRGVRALGLALLSWLLPVMAGLTIAFLAALIFTGLGPLWSTKAAAALLLSALGALVVLINATYQDGAEHNRGVILASAARVGAAAMTPLAALAGYALYLRILQYGLTPERIYASAVLIVGVSYAGAYLIGAFAKPWMKPLERGNIIAAVLVIVVLIALFSPIADPARLSVDDQMQRLEAGRLSPDKLDYTFLRFDGARFGQVALKRLARDRSSPRARLISDAAGRVLAANSRYELDPGNSQNTAQNGAPLSVSMHPATAVLPADLAMAAGATGVLNSCRRPNDPCDGALVDLNGDGVNEVLIANGEFGSLYALTRQGWTQIGDEFEWTSDEQGALRRGEVRTAPAVVRDLVVGSHTHRIGAGSDWPEDAPHNQ